MYNELSFIVKTVATKTPILIYALYSLYQAVTMKSRQCFSFRCLQHEHRETKGESRTRKGEAGERNKHIKATTEEHGFVHRGTGG